MTSASGREVVVVDSGVGNVASAMRGLVRAGARPVLTGDREIVRRARRLVLPGVGAFPAAIARLRECGLDDAICEAAAGGVPVLGICLGHQLLFEESEEFGRTHGLGLLPGRVVPLPLGARVPNMGWSELALRKSDALVAGLGDGCWMYFVHSFIAEPASAEDVLATTGFGAGDVCALVRRDNVCGAQFHPEKSAAAGARLLANFVELK
jgi:glutamine amidotransferase